MKAVMTTVRAYRGVPVRNLPRRHGKRWGAR